MDKRQAYAKYSDDTKTAELNISILLWEEDAVFFMFTHRLLIWQDMD